MIKTINLTGTEQAVKFAGKHTHFHVHSLGGEVLVSLAPNVERGADGVLIVQGGGAGYVQNDIASDTVYLVGAGEVQIVGSGNAFSPFKVGAEGGGNGSVISNGGTITGTVDYPLIALNLYGNSTQDGTPTPDAPIDIVSVGNDGNVEITACGKNLIEGSQDFSGTWIYPWATSEETYQNLVVKEHTGAWNGTAKKVYIKEGKTYTFSAYVKQSGNDTITLYTIPSQSMNIANSADVSKHSLPISVTTEWQRFTHTFTCIKSGYATPRIETSTSSTTVYICGFQLEESNLMTEYEPYKSNAVTITSGLPFCAVGDVRDELVYNADGTGKIIKRTAKLDSYNGEAITTDYISSTGGLDTGAEVVYALENPQETELSAAEITALMKLQTFNGVTHIYNDEGAEMKVKVATNTTFTEMIKPVLDGINAKFEARISALEAAITNN